MLMNAVSLFSGAGGMDLGFETAGIETVLQAEIDPWANKVLARHWPNTRRVNDVRSVGNEHVLHGQERADSAAGRSVHAGLDEAIDLVYGGFPCQDLSVAGKRAGLGGERSSLWYEFHRVVSELRPRWVVVENVPGLLSSDSGRDFGIVLSGLADLGFSVGWAVWDARHFGVAQRRRRVFIVGGPGRHGVASVLSLCESCGGNTATCRATGEGVAATVRGRSANAGVSPPGRGGEDDTNLVVAHTLRVNTGHAYGADLETYVADTAFALTAREAKGVSVMESTTNYVARDGVRRLTPRECERLQGWPDDWTRWDADGKEIADTHRYRMIGNGVAAPVAEWIGRRLLAVDNA